MSEKGVEVVLTGNVGANARATLEAEGIQVVSDVSGTVREAIEGFKSRKKESD